MKTRPSAHHLPKRKLRSRLGGAFGEFCRVFGGRPGAISRLRNAIGSLRRNSFARFAFGVAFLKFREV